MAPSEAQKRAAAKWTKENMATLACKVKKEEAAAFKEYSEKQGKTSNTVLKEFVIQCIDEQIQRDTSNKTINEEKISTVNNLSATQPFPIGDPEPWEIEAIKQTDAEDIYFTQAEIDTIKEAQAETGIPEDQIDWDKIGVDVEDKQ